MRDLYHLITGLMDDCTPDVLRRLRSSINGRLSKRKLTSEQARAMARARHDRQKAPGDGGDES